MQNMDIIQSVLSPIAKDYGVKRLYLFGSFAKGTAHEGSDIDILIEKGIPLSLLKLSDMRQRCQEACTMFGNDYERFKHVSVFQNPRCMCILQIGELCKLVSRELREEEPIIPWKSWCGIRDIFAHQ